MRAETEAEAEAPKVAHRVLGFPATRSTRPRLARAGHRRVVGIAAGELVAQLVDDAMRTSRADSHHGAGRCTVGNGLPPCAREARGASSAVQEREDGSEGIRVTSTGLSSRSGWLTGERWATDRASAQLLSPQ